MENLDEIINEAKEVREVKRALSVKMSLLEMPTEQISQRLNVSEPYVRKWRGKYKSEGAKGLLLGYAGSASYLTSQQGTEIVSWISQQESISVEAVSDYIEATYQVVYQSRQSSYELMQEAGRSYHKSEKKNPQRDEEQVLERREAIKKKWSNTKTS